MEANIDNNSIANNSNNDVANGTKDTLKDKIAEEDQNNVNFVIKI